MRKELDDIEKVLGPPPPLVEDEWDLVKWEVEKLGGCPPSSGAEPAGLIIRTNKLID